MVERREKKERRELKNLKSRDKGVAPLHRNLSDKC